MDPTTAARADLAAAQAHDPEREDDRPAEQV
jgi:hypothetical protein